MRRDTWLVRTMCAILAATVILSTPLDARAWGEKGHRIVGHVARELLVGSDTLAAIEQIMGSDDLANFALYLDQQKVRVDKDIPGTRVTGVALRRRPDLRDEAVQRVLSPRELRLHADSSLPGGSGRHPQLASRRQG